MAGEGTSCGLLKSCVFRVRRSRKQLRYSFYLPQVKTREVQTTRQEISSGYFRSFALGSASDDLSAMEICSFAERIINSASSENRRESIFSVHDEVASSLWCFGSWGSRVPYLQRRIRLAKKLENYGIPQFTRWSKEIVEAFEKEVARAMKRDEEHAVGIYRT